MIKYSLEERIAIYANPFENQFVQVFKQGNAIVFKHLIRSDNSADYSIVLEVATAFAIGTNNCVYILPEINANEKAFRQRIGLNINNGRTPDIMLNAGVFIDVKSPKVERKLSKNAGKASRQSAIVCITDHRMQMDERRLDEYCNRIFSNANYEYSEIYFYINGHLSKRTKANP